MSIHFLCAFGIFTHLMHILTLKYKYNVPVFKIQISLFKVNRDICILDRHLHFKYIYLMSLLKNANPVADQDVKPAK